MRGMMFRPDMHKAIKDNLKTVTRRLDNLKELNQEPERWIIEGWHYSLTAKFSKGARLFLRDDGVSKIIKPRYHVGEIVYIKEVWATEERLDHLSSSEIGGAAIVPLWYKFADKPEEAGEPGKGKWRSPLFMPAWAARGFIKILDVRAERLQSITLKDCLAEGIVHTKEWIELAYKSPIPLHPEDLSNVEADKEIERGWIAFIRQAYANLWDSINPTQKWETNPRIWRIQFDKVDEHEAD